nr:glycosyl hydrolase family 28 protein [Sphingobium lactosutens]
MPGLSIQNSPFWTIHPYLCRDVVIRDVRISAHGHNNDGVDPEMSQNILIEDCAFDQGDDAVSVKSGREDDGWRLATPSRNIVMRNCLVKNGHQLMAIGSEISGGIENVFVDHCRVEQGEGVKSRLNNLLFVKTNERRGGFVRNIHLSNINSTAIAGGVLSVDTDVLYQWRTLVPTYQRKLTPIEGLHIRNVTAASAQYRASVRGEEALPVKGVTLSDVHVGEITGKAVDLTNVLGFSDRLLAASCCLLMSWIGIADGRHLGIENRTLNVLNGSTSVDWMWDKAVPGKLIVERQLSPEAAD